MMNRLAESSGTLKKLSFNVIRVVDVSRWATDGEVKLIDCRKAGQFNGRGSLERVASTDLKPVWEKGSASEIRTAMEKFIADYWKDLLTHAPFVTTEPAEYRIWLKQFDHCLFSTDHISVRYDIAYDGVDIRKVSTGTRGIVLLLQIGRAAGRESGSQ